MFDESKIVTGAEDNTARVWNRETGEAYGPLPLAHKGTSLLPLFDLLLIIIFQMITIININFY
jgi:WD40 repeat protein